MSNIVFAQVAQVLTFADGAGAYPCRWGWCHPCQVLIFSGGEGTHLCRCGRCLPLQVGQVRTPVIAPVSDSIRSVMAAKRWGEAGEWQGGGEGSKKWW